MFCLDNQPNYSALTTHASLPLIEVFTALYPAGSRLGEPASGALVGSNSKNVPPLIVILAVPQVNAESRALMLYLEP